MSSKLTVKQIVVVDVVILVLFLVFIFAPVKVHGLAHLEI